MFTVRAINDWNSLMLLMHQRSAVLKTLLTVAGLLCSVIINLLEQALQAP